MTWQEYKKFKTKDYYKRKRKGKTKGKMKIKKIFILVIFMTTLITNAQIKLTGVVKDSIGPLEMANVIALDTVSKRIVSYGFTDVNGQYKLDLQKNTVYNLKISYIGLKSVDDFIKTADVDLIKSYTMFNDNMLDEITIVSKMPITIKGDTIIYLSLIHI